jgi:uncharacterized protein YggT (Ycf19 family)
MLIALWIVRIYSYVLIAWALSSWFGGFPSPIGDWLNYLVSPVVTLFGSARVGPISFAVVIPLLILFAIESWIKRKLEPPPQPPAPSQDA